VFVSNTVHDQVRDRLPFVFEDLGEQQVKNITRPVRVFRVQPTLTLPPPSARAPSLSRIAGEGGERSEPGEGGSVLALPDKPSIAVLPFANVSGDPEQEYFADGMVEEIITALSPTSWLFVIARNSSFTYKGQAVDVKQVGRDLGVRYVLEGSVRKAGGRVRITAQLIDALSGAHLWADRFDGSLEDVFELRDRVAVSVAGVIDRHCKRQRCAAPPCNRRPTPPPTISTCARSSRNASPARLVQPVRAGANPCGIAGTRERAIDQAITFSCRSPANVALS
jgi:adenylate cyclase